MAFFVSTLPATALSDIYPWAASPIASAAELPSWARMLERHALQRGKLDACLLDPSSCQGRYRSAAYILKRAQTLEEADRIALIHRYVNRQPYRSDRSRKVVDENTDQTTTYRNQWATLDDFLTRGGDCEDFAVAKYFLLRELGVSADRLRIVVTYERRERDHHALLAIRFPATQDSGEEDVWLLESDNNIDRAPHLGYRYVYALNENHVWDHASKS